MPIFPTFTTILAALRKHITLALFLVALLASAFLAYSWLDARRAAAQLAATLATQQKIISSATAAQSARDAALTQTLAQIAALKQSVQSPQQASAALVQTLPQFIDSSTGAPLPAPLQFIPNSPAIASPKEGTVASGNSTAPPQQNVVIPSAARDLLSTAPTTGASSPPAPAKSPAPAGFLSYLKSQISNVKSFSRDAPISAPGANFSTPAAPQHSPGELPTAHGNSSSAPQQGIASPGNSSTPIPGSICIPPADLKPLYDSIEDCEACAAKLTASQADLADETTKFTAASSERDAALKAAHGTFWSHAKTAAKWIIIGAAAGAILAKYH
jgi:hypothetical protein